MFRSVLKASPQKVHLMSMQSRSLQGLVVGVPKESFEGERRVAIAPVHVAKLKKAGATVNIEAGAGAGSGYFDEIYVKAGANMVSSDEAWKAQVVAKVRPPTFEEAKRIGNRALVSIVQPRQNVGKCKILLFLEYLQSGCCLFAFNCFSLHVLPMVYDFCLELMNQLVAQKATVLSLDSLLRTLSRGQAFDVLSSQANVAGYRAVIEAAHQLQRPFAGTHRIYF